MTILCNKVANIAGGSTWYYLKELLKTAGWTVRSSGDGLSAFSNSADIITQSSTGANGMNNSSAWFVIQQPTVGGVNRQFMIQRPASSSNATIKYSYSAGFTGGAATATTPFTATDTQSIATNQTMWAADTFFHLMLGAENSDGYGFWMAVILNGNPNTNNSGGLLFEPMVAGTYFINDVDPYVIWSETTSSGSFNAAKLAGQGPGSCYFSKGTSLETFANVGACNVSNSGGNSVFPLQAGTSGITKKEQIAPILWGKNFVNTGLVAMKGVGTIMKWNGTLKAPGQLLTVNSAGDRVCIADVNFPWDGSAVFV